jgi:preprotein translocase subunit YajC
VPLGLVLIVLALLFIYMVVLRPQRRRQVEQTRMWAQLEEGDEIVTAGGIYGTITGFDGDDLLVEIAPDLVVKVARRAVAGTVAPPGEDEDEYEDEDDDEAEGVAEGGDELEEPAAEGPEDDEPDEATATTRDESYPEGPR